MGIRLTNSQKRSLVLGLEEAHKILVASADDQKSTAQNYASNLKAAQELLNELKGRGISVPNLVNNYSANGRAATRDDMYSEASSLYRLSRQIKYGRDAQIDGKYTDAMPAAGLTNYYNNFNNQCVIADAKIKYNNLIGKSDKFEGIDENIKSRCFNNQTNNNGSVRLFDQMGLGGDTNSLRADPPRALPSGAQPLPSPASAKQESEPGANMRNNSYKTAPPAAKANVKYFKNWDKRMAARICYVVEGLGSECGKDEQKMPHVELTLLQRLEGGVRRALKDKRKNPTRDQRKSLNNLSTAIQIANQSGTPPDKKDIETVIAMGKQMTMQKIATAPKPNTAVKTTAAKRA